MLNLLLVSAGRGVRTRRGMRVAHRAHNQSRMVKATLARTPETIRRYSPRHWHPKGRALGAVISTGLGLVAIALQ